MSDAINVTAFRHAWTELARADHHALAPPFQDDVAATIVPNHELAAACMGRTTTFAQPAESQGPRASADADHLHRWQSQPLR